MINIQVQISYLPLCSNFNEVIELFLLELNKTENINITTNAMSTVLAGDYHIVFNALQNVIFPFIQKYPSVFNITISNCCDNCTIN
ncbi:MAG TPA: YkoF family thiamine/hydroxymethylpyrimidine-binding protein [Bacteroidales bacterium]|nr:YkoF family thiamine/hydroxymethylpyrimidine-binding protein [Bacteroidales bacterium]